MEQHVAEWVGLVLRWLHLITGAAWIGTSFYFNWLNHSFRPPDEARAGVGGELWAIHGGGFYQVTKYEVAPARLPKTLHWFKWEAYLTWITGVSLLAVVYYFNAGTFMVDPAVRPLEPWQAILIGVGALVLGWIVYDLLCRSPLGQRPVAFALVGFALATAASYALTRLLGNRAAYIHVGAMLGTMMAANVFVHIIPKQRLTVDAMLKGEKPDPKHGKLAAQRSLHNNYLTLPVLFIMVSNHFPFTYGHEWNWAVLAGISLAGAGTRHWFNLRNRGEKSVWILPAAAVAMLGLAFVTAPHDSFEDAPPVAFDTVRTIIENRCLQCHSQTPTHEAFREPPLGVAFDDPAQIATLAARINSVVVVTKTMPLGNMTGITDEEREQIGAWFYQGARR